VASRRRVEEGFTYDLLAARLEAALGDLVAGLPRPGSGGLGA
jgi:hypothetical protein